MARKLLPAERQALGHLFEFQERGQHYQIEMLLLAINLELACCCCCFRQPDGHLFCPTCRLTASVRSTWRSVRLDGS